MGIVDNLPLDLQLLKTNPGIRLGDWAAINQLLKALGGVQTNDSITASTTQTQAAGTAVSLGFTNVSTVGSSNDAVTFPLSGPGYWLIITNSAASNTMKAFPAVGDAINAAGANNAVTVANATTSLYVCTAKGQWWGGPITNEA